MKSSERGPFVNVRWFCQDGSVLPPKAYACRDHGGGFQHGNYSQQTKTLRSKGYYIANFLAGIDAKAFIQNDTFIDQYNQILIEKFLGHLDNGWILRKAQFYRGAIQEEDERAGARNLLMELSGQPAWISHRYLGLRSGVRLLPHGKDTASMQKMRQLAASLSDSDRGFKKIRIKIHGSPDASDAQMVRDYVTEKQPEDKAPYLELVDEIDAIYKASPLSDTLRADAKIYSGAPWLQDFLRKMADDLEKNDLENNSSTIKQYQITATALADMREFMPRIKSASARLRLLDLSLIIEAHNFKSSTELHKVLDKMTRSERLSLLENIAQASYGAGIINQRSYAQIKQSIESLNKDKIALKQYINELNYLARVPGWGTQGMRFQFYASMQKLGAIEPLSFHFIQDQLRGSPLMFFSQVLNDLSIDVNHLSGVKHSIFGKKTGIGFHALNPGFVRGTLHTDIRLENIAAIKPDGIYLLPETVSDLPPLSGIITAGEGNPLSHVQLLARNLGIPNVTISEDLIASLEQHNGEIIVMAVSPLGLVEIMSDSPKWREYFNKDSNKDNIRIRPDLEKLDVKFREFINLKELRAKDSGRIVGPKAAKLGELKHIYPDKVANGLAIPFGIFRASVLDKPYKNTSKTVYQWMLEQYDIIRSLESKPAQHEQKSEAFRAELYDIIMHSKMSDALIASFRKAMQDAFGTTNLGVFVRSDTNVEDLPGFTGAGLNLTMPNVIGFDNLINAINDVWASPFTKRAFAWRQSHMEKPQYVYPSILLLRSVDNEKSGVMVTEDITTGARDIISVAVNEGVGGAVDGQSAESLRININDGSVKVLATATAPLRRQAASTGGVVALPVSGSDTILQPDEIKQLIAFAKKLVTSQ
ncbi:PEP/pyruvate-binding domain-containing protein [sulfur-oxidizing endosymbiont of Gigantopelta aegis]|uniref:PEP/pyruvate-binding domain-containing protein n=1 Tax=sulfur-oxidizing endosymbiont of Gigantopelta aegis TaxID=2794934 RepID=UPI001BE3E076|nr:PEP/pyruvate-binding domain-containing protein [sulfur-oxidizing endosymbiont of Gigantopelta aegis]